jgi:hypothetical protein
MAASFSHGDCPRCEVRSWIVAVVPAHSASKTRVNALMPGTHIPEAVVTGPRFREDDKM